MKLATRRSHAAAFLPRTTLVAASDLPAEQFDQKTGKTALAPIRPGRAWLRAGCSFLTEWARFGYSADGKLFTELGVPFTTVYQHQTFQGVRYSLYRFNIGGSPSGYADFTELTMAEPRSGGLTRPIPAGKAITLAAAGSGSVLVARGLRLATVP